MCGIVGLAGNGIIETDLEVFRQLFRVSTLRGKDGTGLFQGRFDQSHNSYIIEKKPIEVNAFFNWAESKNGNKFLIKSVHDNIFIGHTRWATTGDLSETNCHPFHVGDIVGVHNGTLKDKKYDHKTTVDSYLLYKDIVKRGLKKVLEELDGDSAFALVFFNMETDTITFVRNHRPLWICKHKFRQVVYWASEEDMLKFILKRNNIAATEPVYFEKGKVYNLKISDIKDTDDLAFATQTVNLKEASKKKNGGNTYTDIDWDAWAAAHKTNSTKIPTQNRTSAVNSNNNTNNTLNDDIPFGDPTLGPVIIPDEVIIKYSQNHKIPIEECISCAKKLKLIDQYLANKVPLKTGGMMYECEECTKVANEVSQALSQKLGSTIQ